MFLWFGNKTSVQAVRGGRKVVADCPGCGATCQFHECRQKKSFNLYVVVPLLEDQQTVFRCTNCGGVFEMVAEPEAEVTADVANRRDRRAAEKARRKQQKLEERREREAKRLAEARRLAEQKRRQKAAAERERKIEDDLAALKRRMGQD